MTKESDFVKKTRRRAQEVYGKSDEEYCLITRIKKSITCFRPGKLLDVGTERGTTAEKLVKMGFDVTAVDVDKLSVQKARKRGIKAFQIDVQEEALPFQARYFDTVWAGEIIEHLIDPLNFFSEVRRVLKDDGVFVFTVPNITSLKNRVRVLLCMMPQFACGYTSLWHGHMRDYNIAEVRALLAKSGFEVSRLLADKVQINVLNFGPLADIAPTLGDILIITAKKV